MTTGSASAIAAGVWIAAAVLVWAGVAKLRRPGGTATALALVHLPPSRVLARALGGAEVLIGGAALTLGGGVAAALVATAYAGFAAVSVRGRGRPQASCGCFGDREAPLTTTHVVVNVVLAAVSLAAVAAGAPGPVQATAGSPVLLGAVAVLLATAAGLVAAVLTTVPALARTVTPSPAPQVR